MIELIVDSQDETSSYDISHCIDGLTRWKAFDIRHRINKAMEPYEEKYPHHDIEVWISDKLKQSILKDFFLAQSGTLIYDYENIAHRMEDFEIFHLSRSRCPNHIHGKKYNGEVILFWIDFKKS